jgi:hypothetical protein
VIAGILLWCHSPAKMDVACSSQVTVARAGVTAGDVDGAACPHGQA